MFDDVLAANERYAAAFPHPRLKPGAAKGLAVLTCIDSRIDPLAMLGLEPGDAKIIRNAGARASDDALRSLVLAVNLLGVRRVCVVQHTECAVVGASTDELLRDRVAEACGADTSSWTFLASDDQEATLRADLATIRSCELLPDDLELGGFVFDVQTGRLTQIEATFEA